VADFRFQFNVAGVPQVDRTLRICADRCEDMSPAFETLHSGRAWIQSKSGKSRQFRPFLQIQAEQFRTQGGRGGRTIGGATAATSRWAKLTDAYAEQKAKIAPGAPILVLTGTLRDSLRSASHPGHVVAITKRSAAFGTAVEYAGFHQTGTRKMKARPPIALTGRDKADWVRVLQRFIVDSFGPEERAGEMRAPGATA